MGDLRRATPADAVDLTRLRGHMHAAMGVDPEVPRWAQAVEAAFRRRLAEPDRFAAWLVEVDGRAVSGGAGWIEEHLPSPRSLDGRRGYIASMSTDPGHRHKGYARLVFVALMDWFGAAQVPRVDLRATRDGRPLYEAHGFRERGGATLMSWTASPSAAPGLGATPR